MPLPYVPYTSSDIDIPNTVEHVEGKYRAEFCSFFSGNILSRCHL